MTLLSRALLLCAGVVAGGSAVAQQEIRPYAPGTPQFGIGGRPDAPATAVLPSDEDWSGMAGEGSLKWVDLGAVALSFGFDGRIGFERYDDRRFGDVPGEDTTLHLRAISHVALTFGDRARLFGALKFGQVKDSDTPVSPADDDGPDLHQLFAEVSFGDIIGLDTKDAFVRVGRQELHYGAGRLVSIRNGPNVRYDFNGVLARARVGRTVVDVFAMRPSENDPGPWNNGLDDGQAVWGVYGSASLDGLAPWLARGNADLFYIGFDRAESAYAVGPTVNETRHTLGARLWSAGPPTRGFGYDVEAGVQVGEVRGAGRPSDIRAGYVAGTLAYGFADALWTPVLGLRVGASSGDDDPGDDRLGTFRAPFPPGRYFGDATPLGPGNLGGLGPSFAVTPAQGLTLTARYQAFWRLETADGVYTPPQTPLRGAMGTERFVGDEISLSADYALSDAATLTTTIARFDAGAFLKDAGPGADTTFAQIKLNLRF